MINVYWTDAHETIVRLDYYPPVASWNEYHQAVAKSVQLAKSKGHTVHFLHNPGSVPMPRGNPLVELRRAHAVLPDNTGLMVMVVTNTFAVRMLEIVIRFLIMPNARLVTSLEEAHRCLNQAQLGD